MDESTVRDQNELFHNLCIDPFSQSIEDSSNIMPRNKWHISIVTLDLVDGPLRMSLNRILS